MTCPTHRPVHQRGPVHEAGPGRRPALDGGSRRDLEDGDAWRGDGSRPASAAGPSPRAATGRLGLTAPGTASPSPVPNPFRVSQPCLPCVPPPPRCLPHRPPCDLCATPFFGICGVDGLALSLVAHRHVEKSWVPALFSIKIKWWTGLTQASDRTTTF